MHGLTKTFALLLLLATCTECGRKQRTIFYFPEKEIVSINKLMLPAVRGLQAKAEGNNARLTWQPVTMPPTTTHQSPPPTVIGYHVYRFAKGRFVAKHPITKRPVVVPEFIDASSTKNKHQFCYMIRAVFSTDNQIIQGPASHITHIHD